MANLCCTYKVSRRGLLLTTMLTFLFSIIFLGVGGVSVRFGQQFVNDANDYCEERCIVSTEVVGCDCRASPPHTQLPTVFFLSPAIGLIIVGIFTFFTSILGCAGAIRERNMLLSLYICAIMIVIILQFGFGVAAASVASGDAAQVQGPLEAVLKKKYQEFDWSSMDLFFPKACYEGARKVNVTSTLFGTGSEYTYTFKFPLCDYEGDCRFNDPLATDEFMLKARQNDCCDSSRKCRQDKKEICMSGSECVESFLGRVGAPIAVVAFLALVVEITALIFACIIRLGQPGRSFEDRA